ncbi:hypothetical protein OAO87_04740, partial [bacterium]|nr:hypothetical protein [bacterium]
MVLPWRAPDANDGDTTYLILMDSVGAPKNPWLLRETSISTEDMIFLGDATTGALTGGGLSVALFMIDHTSPQARAAFEAACGLTIKEDLIDDYLCLASIPQEGSDLGMTLLVRPISRLPLFRASPAHLLVCRRASQSVRDITHAREPSSREVPIFDFEGTRAFLTSFALEGALDPSVLRGVHLSEMLAAADGVGAASAA